jgi:hypothetical protein
MSALWNLINESILHSPATAALLVAGLLLCRLLLRAIALFLAFRLSRRAIEQGYPVEAASGREFYFRIPALGGRAVRPTAIQKPRPTASGARLRALRVDRHFTLAGLSHASSISSSRLSAIETGRTRLLDSDIEAVAEILHLAEKQVAELRRLTKQDAEVFEEL